MLELAHMVVYQTLIDVHITIQRLRLDIIPGSTYYFKR
jgi:hypothetical protein